MRKLSASNSTICFKMFKKCIKLRQMWLIQRFCCHVGGGSYLQIGWSSSAAGTARR